MTTHLDSFVRTSTGKGRFPGDRRKALLTRATIALSLASWLCLVPVLLNLHLPGFPAPNLPVLLPLLAALIASPLMVVRDDWVRARLMQRVVSR